MTNNGVIYDTVYYKFFNRSFYFTGASNLTVTPQSTYFDMDSEDYAIDFLFKPLDVAGSQILVEKLNSYKISIESGKLKLWLSNNGVAYTHTLTQAGTINPGIRYHFEICRSGDVFSMFINGSKEVPTVTLAAVFDNASPVVIGSTYTGAMEEIRFSDDICRHVLDFTIPDRPYSAPNYYTTQVDDIDREIRRTEILPIPGAGDILGVTIFDTDTYAVRNDTDNLTALLYKSSVTGWTPLVETLNPGGKYRWNVGQYPELVDHQREPVLFFTSGVDFPKYLDDSTIVDITHANLPDDALTSFYANNLIEFKSRLFLAYPDGRLLFSSVDNPLDFDPIAGAGEIYMEDEIVDLVIAPGDVLVVLCRTSTFLIKALADASDASGATTAQYKFYKETFSKKSGAIPYTSQRILGTVISMNDRGITNLEATDTFGDFSAGFLSKNVQVTLLSSKHLISATVVHRTNNQYRMFFSNGNGLIFTFDSEKKLKGVTKMKYEVPILNVAEGED
ncbi:hypothetical protein JZU68_03840, partial [bacterium]|nr:hypothetical protein [bacterium]